MYINITIYIFSKKDDTCTIYHIKCSIMTKINWRMNIESVNPAGWEPLYNLIGHGKIIFFCKKYLKMLFINVDCAHHGLSL